MNHQQKNRDQLVPGHAPVPQVTDPELAGVFGNFASHEVLQHSRAEDRHAAVASAAGAILLHVAGPG